MSLAARPLNPLLWIGLPMIQALALIVLFAIPLRVFGLSLPEPVFVLVPTFAWPVIRPSITAPFAVLGMGLMLDIFWGAPVGLWGLSLLVAYGVVLAGRSWMVGQSTPVMWAWYVAICGVAFGSAYLFSMLDSGGEASFIAVGWQFLATIVLYPFAHWLIERFEDADVRFR